MTHGDLRDSQGQGPYYRQRKPNTQWLRIQTSFPLLGIRTQKTLRFPYISSKTSRNWLTCSLTLLQVATDFPRGQNQPSLSQVIRVGSCMFSQSGKIIKWHLNTLNILFDGFPLWPSLLIGVPWCCSCAILSLNASPLSSTFCFFKEELQLKDLCQTIWVQKHSRCYFFSPLTF